MSKKYENVWQDENGNYYASNKSRETGPGVSSGSDSSIKPAAEINRDMQQNVINSMGSPAGPGEGYVTIGSSPGGGSPISRRREKYSEASYDYTPYTPSARVTAYQKKLRAYENAEKPEWQSKYEPAIQSILDGILNRKSFDLNKDPNYQTLYDKYAQNYMALGNKAMRDQLGAASAITGGYGSTAAQAAAGQAYDSYMQNLNERDLQLMNLAYQMYGDERADRYNQLSAVNNQDNIDYGRYRDDVGDFYTDRNYFADRYQQEYANDYNRYADALNFGRSVYEDERNYETGLEDTEYGRYKDALSLAMQYTQKGLEVPDYIAQTIKDYTGEDDISNVIAAMPQTSGGRGGRSGGRSGSEDYFDGLININTARDIIQNDASEETAIEALDEAYMNYFSGRIPSSSAQGRAQALQQIINEYMKVTGITEPSMATTHFDKLVKKNGGDAKRTKYSPSLDYTRR